MPKKAPRLDPELVRQQIELQQRDPFIDLLTTYLSAQPSREAIQAFATKKPDRWVQAVKILSQLAGYSTRNIVEEGLFVEIVQMSDSELNLTFNKFVEDIRSEDVD